MFHRQHVSAAWAYFIDSYIERVFGTPIATLYKTNEIYTICLLPGTFGQRHAARTRRSRAYIRKGKIQKDEIPMRTHLFLILALIV